MSVYRNELLYVYNGASEWENINDTVVVVQASDLVKLNADHTIRIGLDFRDNSATSDAVLAGKVGYEVYSASTMWDWQITPGVSLTNAVRFDHFVLNQQGYLVPAVGYPASAYNGAHDQPAKLQLRPGVEGDRPGHVPPAWPPAGCNFPASTTSACRTASRPVRTVRATCSLATPASAPPRSTTSRWTGTAPCRVLNSTLRAAVFAQRTDNILINPYETTASGDGLIVDGVEEQRAVAQNVGSSSAAGTEIGLRGHSPSGLRWNASYSFISIYGPSVDQPERHLQSAEFRAGNADACRGAGRRLYRRAVGAGCAKPVAVVVPRLSRQPDDVTLQPIKVGNYFLADARVGYRLTR